MFLRMFLRIYSISFRSSVYVKCLEQMLPWKQYKLPMMICCWELLVGTIYLYCNNECYVIVLLCTNGFGRSFGVLFPHERISMSMISFDSSQSSTQVSKEQYSSSAGSSKVIVRWLNKKSVIGEIFNNSNIFSSISFHTSWSINAFFNYYRRRLHSSRSQNKMNLSA